MSSMEKKYVKLLMVPLLVFLPLTVFWSGLMVMGEAQNGNKVPFSVVLSVTLPVVLLVVFLVTLFVLLMSALFWHFVFLANQGKGE